MKESNPKRKHQFFRRWLLDWAILSLIGLSFSVSYFITATEPVSFYEALNWQFTRFQIWAVFAPIIVWLGRRARSEKQQVFRIIAFNLPSSVFLSVVVTAIFPFIFILTTSQQFSYEKLSGLYRTIAVSNSIMGLVIYWAVLTANYAIDYYDDFRAEKHRAALLENQLAQAKLHALKMQLNPHFLFNTLNSISSLVLDNPKAANRMIARLGDFLRLTLDNDSNQEVTLERELEFLKCYLEIERIRFQDRLTINFEIDEATLNAQVPNLILQPLVENAIKHGIAPHAKSGRVDIRGYRKNGSLQLSVRDTGAGLSKVENGNPAKLGIGISNTRERLKQLYGENFKFDFANAAEGGLIVTVEMPFNLKL
ncbi:MAG: histidine kinase [Pyrinomonadaceae bacterium]|nr:histidine kinase [Pyrinomonadaceae bacterium]